jgi:diguanylate cyclase
MIARFMSWRTLLTGLVGIVVIVTTWALVQLQIGGPNGTRAASDLGELVVVAGAAVITLRTALSYSKDDSLRGQWLLVGLGVASFAVGDLVWSFYEIVLGVLSPFPGLADVFYVAQYGLFGAGLIAAALSYRCLVQIRTPLLVGATAGVVAVFALYVGLLAPYVLVDPSTPLLERLLGTLYPMADMLLIFGPAVAVLMIVVRIGGGRLGWPWLLVGLGAIMMALSDTGFVWLESIGGYSSGNIIDYGWSLGMVFIAVGAMLDRDLVAVADGET